MSVNTCTVGAILDAILAGFLTVIVGLLWFTLGIEAGPDGKPVFHMWPLILFSLLVTILMAVILIFVPVLNMTNC